MRSFDYRHTVTFEDTNLVGNVYYVNFIRWQGRCRELFLLQYCPGVESELRRGMSLVTTRVRCEFLAELAVFDKVIVRMRLLEQSQNRLTMGYEYWRERTDRDDELVAVGEQQVAFLRREDGEMTPVPVPQALREAVDQYTS